MKIKHNDLPRPKHLTDEMLYLFLHRENEYIPVKVKVKKLDRGWLEITPIDKPWMRVYGLRKQIVESAVNLLFARDAIEEPEQNHIKVIVDKRLRLVRSVAQAVEGRPGWVSEGGLYPDKFSYNWQGGEHPAATIDDRGKARFYSFWRNAGAEIAFRGEDGQALVEKLESLVNRELAEGFLSYRRDISRTNLVRIASGPLLTGPPSNIAIIEDATRLYEDNGSFFIKSRPEKGEHWQPTPILGICNPSDVSDPLRGLMLL